MPFVPDEPSAGPLEPVVSPVPVTPVNERGVWRSAFDTENDIVALMKIIELGGYQRDPNFNLYERGKDDPLFQQDPEQFLSATSLEQYEAIRARYVESILSRQTLEKGGLNPVAATIAASVASPTLLIPGGQIVRGLSMGRSALRLAGTAGAGGAAAIGIQESILQAAPNDRSLEESIFNIGIGTLLSSGIGAGVGAAVARRVTAREVYVPDEAPSAVPDIEVRDNGVILVNDKEIGKHDGKIFHSADGEDTIPGVLSDVIKKIRGRFLEGSVGAAQIEEITPINPTQTNEALIGAEGDVRLDSALGLENTIGRISPTVRGYVNKYSNTVRDMMRRLDSGGLLFRSEDGRFVADSDVATRAKTWEGVYYKAKLRSQHLIRDYHASSIPTSERLATKDIMQQAADAIDGGLEDFTGPEIVKQIARAYQEEVFIPFAEEAKRLDFVGNEHWMDPTKYVPHMVRRTMVANDHEDFVQILTEYFSERLTQRVSQDLERLQKQTAKREQEAADISLSPDEAAELRSRLEGLEREINDSLKPPSRRKLERAQTLREKAKSAEPERAKELRAQATALEQSNKELRQRHARLQGITRRRRNLNKSILGVQERIQKKNEQISAAENQNLRTLNSLVVRAHGLLQRIERAKGSRIAVKDLNEFNDDVNKLIKSMDDFVAKHPDYAALARDATTREGKAKAASLIQGLRDAADVKTFSTPARLRRERGIIRGKITRAYKAGRSPYDLIVEESLKTREIKSLENDFQTLRDNLKPVNPYRFMKVSRQKFESINQLQQRLLDLEEARSAIVTRRALRIDKLQTQRDALDPEAPVRRAKELREKIEADAEALYAKLREEGIELSGDKFNVSALARKQAEVIATKFTGEIGRIPLISTILERGPELERTLDIDPLRVWSNGRRFADFMERDLDVLSRLYTRTVGSDFEVFREFGSLTPFNRESGRTGIMARIQEDFEAARAAAAKNPKELAKIARSRRTAERDLSAVVDRIRHLRGIPEDPAGLLYRAGRATLNLNTLRLMGGVVVASLADPARLIIKQGMTSVYRDGLQTLFNNMQAITGLRREVKAAAVGLDMLTHGRMAAMADVFDDFAPGTRIERGLQFATNNMGRIALFDVWNSFWKQTAGVMTMQRLVHDIENVVKQVDNIAEAERFLARAGINDDIADRIWRQLTEVPEGADSYKGVLVPNTANWDDLEAARAMRSAVLRVVDDTIVTPSAERPLLMDGTIIGRLLFQFRSFAFASLTKTLMHGAQEARYGNLSIPVGMAISVGLGALSWWAWANLAGDHQRERMEKADFAKWIDEAVNRSGLLGPLQEFLNTASKFPSLAPYTTFGGEATTRSFNPYRTPLVDAFGPTRGLIRDLETLIGTSGEPREATVNAAVRMMPFQNLFYLRPLIERGKSEAGRVVAR